MVKVALTGGAYQAHSVIASAQRSLNLFSEPLPSGNQYQGTTGQGEPSAMAHYPTPGLRLLGTIGTGPIRGIRQCTTGGVYVVSGSTLYSVNTSNWTGTALGSLTAGLRTPVSMQDNGLDLIVVDGTANGWDVTLASNTMAGIPPSISASQAGGATMVANGTSYRVGDNVTAIGGTLLSGQAPVLFTVTSIDSGGGITGLKLAAPGTYLTKPDDPTPLDTGGPGSRATVHLLYNNLTIENAFYGADRVDYLDTFFLFNKPGTPQFYISGSLAVTFDPLDFANKEAYSDLLVTLIVAGRLVYLFGERTTEVWYDAGATDIGAGSFQFAPMQSYVIIDHGCAAKYSPAVFDGSVFWLTQNRQGQGFVMQVTETKTKRISTYAIEAEIAGYARIDDAIGFCYQLAGHAFYVLTFPEANHTWCYEPATGHWHEWAWIDTNGAEHRHRANCFWPVNDTLVVGDWQNGNLYALDNRVFTDNGQPIKRVRTYPHMLNDGKRVFYRQFLADMETGTAPDLTATTTVINKIITWLPNIAQMTGVSVGAITGTTGGTFVDWQRGFVYLAGQTGYQKYTTALVTQSPMVTVTAPSRFISGGDVDPLSGDLIVQTDPGNPNGVPVYKLDPNTFAVLGTFGIATSIPAYPTSVWQGQSIVCVVCNGVSFGFLKYSVSSGVVSAFRVDTMGHAGFSAAIVSGSTNNRGSMCAGKSGGSAASVFLSWDGATAPRPSVPLYRIDVAASATAYNPATWPATNPGITWTTVGTVAVSAVDPAWTGFTVYSLGYDEADGNVLMLVGTSNTTDGYHILKLSATTAAVMWNIAIGVVTVNLGGSRINGSLWMFRNVDASAGPTSSYRIDTLTGTMTTQPLSGVFASPGPQAQRSDSETSVMLFGGNFTAGSSAPTPVAGTSTFSGGWASMGGQTVTTTVTSAKLQDNLISLRWSDDRGHTYGNPVTQDIGPSGDYLTSLQWQRLSYGRDRVFELSWSVPMKTALQGAWVDVTPAQS